MSEPKSPDETHDWFVLKPFGWKCCRHCGYVRRADRKNKPCPGVVKIGLRLRSAPPGIEIEGEGD